MKVSIIINRNVDLHLYLQLLSWMRTPKQNGLDSSKEFKGEFCCLRAQVSSDSEVQDIRTNSFSFNVPSHEPKPPRNEEELRLDEDGFCGFLANGTLGADPETPKFEASVAKEDKKEMAKLITEKLEEFLEEYSKDAKGGRESNVCPLQGHDHFQRSIELTKRSNGGVNKKKGFITSLFKRRQREFHMQKHSSRDLIKRLFEKLHGTSPLKSRNDDDDVSMPRKKELRKSAQTFRRKVHPVFFTPAVDDNKLDVRRSYINRYRENWIKTDAECKSRCHRETFAFMSISGLLNQTLLFVKEHKHN